MHQKLTIVIPTYERPRLLERKIFHLALQGCKSRIIILDTSGVENLERNKTTIRRFGAQLNVDYQPCDPSVHFIAKIARGVKQSSTAFTAVSFDDDFLVLETAYKGIGFLETHDNYASASGHVLDLERPRPPIKSPARVPVMGKADVFEHPHPLERLSQFLASRRKRNPLFNVWRTSFLDQILAPVSDVPWTKYSETLLQHLATYAGPTKKLDALYEVRSVDYRKESYRSHGLKGFAVTFETDFLDKDFYPVLAGATALAVKYIQKGNKITTEIATKHVIENFLVHRTQKAWKSRQSAPTLCKKLAESALARVVAMTLRRLWHVRLFFNPSNLIRCSKMVDIYGFERTGQMLRLDPGFRFNHASLVSGASPYREAYQGILRSHAAYPDTTDGEPRCIKP